MVLLGLQESTQALLHVALVVLDIGGRHLVVWVTEGETREGTREGSGEKQCSYNTLLFRDKTFANFAVY